MTIPGFENDVDEFGRSRTRADEEHTRDFLLSADNLPTWRDAKASLERWLLKEALVRSGGNMAAAGRLLGVTKVAVLHAVRRHGLEAYTRPHREG